MSDEFVGDVSDVDRDLMEGLLFDLGVFGDHHHQSMVSAAHRPCSAGAPTVERGFTPAACGAPPTPVDDPLRQLTEKCVHMGKSVSVNHRNYSSFYHFSNEFRMQHIDLFWWRDLGRSMDTIPVWGI